jgi:hypothetical protein
LGHDADATGLEITVAGQRQRSQTCDLYRLPAKAGNVSITIHHNKSVIYP